MTGRVIRSLLRGYGSIQHRPTLATAYTAHRSIHTACVTQGRAGRIFTGMVQYDGYDDWSLTALRKWLKKGNVKVARNDHSYNPERFSKLGPDLSVAHFVLARGGAVKFVEDERWLTTYNRKDPDYIAIPGHYVENLYIEAVNWSGGPMMYESFDNFVLLEKLKYLNLSNCPNMTDWCLDRMHMFNELVHLDISGCDQITERGLACLHRLKNLKYLAVNNMQGVKQKPLVAVYMEEMLPNCEIEGLTYVGMENYEWETDTAIPVYLIEEGAVTDSNETERFSEEQVASKESQSSPDSNKGYNSDINSENMDVQSDLKSSTSR